MQWWGGTTVGSDAWCTERLLKGWLHLAKALRGPVSCQARSPWKIARALVIRRPCLERAGLSACIP